MTDSRPPILEELDSVAIGPAPIGDILHAARSDRRRRRAVLATVAAVSVLLLIGGGLVTAQGIGDNNDDESPVASPENSEGTSTKLTATVSTPAPVGSFLDLVRRPWARWDESKQALTFVAVGAYSRTCPPTVTVDSDGAVANLRLGGTAADSAGCLVDTRFVLVTVTGFDQTPTTLVVTEGDTTNTYEVDGSINAADLSVSVEPFTPEPSLSGIASGLARWNSETQILDYISRVGYSGTCPPEGRVSANGHALELTLTAITDKPCTADPPFMLVTITGLTEAPAEFMVTENGEQRTVIVTTAEPADLGADDSAPASCEALARYFGQGGTSSDDLYDPTASILYVYGLNGREYAVTSDDGDCIRNSPAITAQVRDAVTANGEDLGDSDLGSLVAPR